MDKLKLYAAPLVGLVLLLLWFFVVRPMMADQEAPPAKQDQNQGPSGPSERVLSVPSG